ncbi:MAG: indolepyruvate oxidoreductase subunit beta [Chloroflexi bacterium]|nr:indolepyruvate oxidoreductase subunit beta [Chloroflexota bacterium]
MTHNLLFAGVGGQGVVLASEVLARVAASEGFDVKQGEVHGAAQRGGAVVSHIRFGERVYSPLNLRGRVDLLVAFEQLEAVRWAHYLKPGGVLIINDHRIEPTYLNAAIKYPANPAEFLASKSFRVVELNATRSARELGNERVSSLVMLGAASKFIPLKDESWQQVLGERIPAKLLDINRRAFAAGRNAIA